MMDKEEYEKLLSLLPKDGVRCKVERPRFRAPLILCTSSGIHPLHCSYFKRKTK